ncbi:histone-lysine N-methyltransferase 2B isoform X2 [Engraulis encrasicolus]|uniref:histone-lysine N-methyltransferase 2B isoform X2 n=1 Tax=Engraulis encrasicolus TaxID=184585 RepID=UPI002FD77007
MAAAGGGLPASALLTGVNTSNTVRCRFPARPCTSRNQARSEKRYRIGRQGSENGESLSKGPRPVNIGLTLQEDPSLLRLLRIAEKHKRKREAGFDSSGGEEEDSFVGFGVNSGRSLRSSRSQSQSTPLKSVSSPEEKPPPAPDLKKEKDATAPSTTSSSASSSTPTPPQSPPLSEIKPLYGKIVKRGEKKIRKFDPSDASTYTSATTKPKLVVKFGIKKTTKDVSLPKSSKAEQAAKSSAKAIRKDDDVEEASSDESHAKKQQSTSKGIKVKSPSPSEEGTSQKKSKVVWTMTTVKGQQGKNASAGASAKGVSTSDGGKGASPMLGKFVKRSRPPTQEEGSDNLSSSAEPSPGQRRNPSQMLWIPQKRRTNTGVASSSATAVSPKAVGKQRRVSKGAEGSPEEGAEAGRESGHEPSDQPSGDHQRGAGAHLKMKRRRRSGVDDEDQHGRQRHAHKEISQEQQPELGEQGLTPVEEGTSSTVTPVVSGRSSRVIKTPKRFLDDDRMSHLLPKSPQKKNNGLGSSSQETDAEGRPLPLKSSSGHRRRGAQDLQPEVDMESSDGGNRLTGFQEDRSTSETAVAAVMPAPPPVVAPPAVPRLKIFLPPGQVLGSGSGKFYERLKKLTSTLAQKKVQTTLAGAAENWQQDAPEGALKVEEGMSVNVRDLGERVLVEQEGSTHRISSSNKRMFHLLKRAKVQLIKIDQQKQLKSSQLLSGSVHLGETAETGVKRRRRRIVRGRRGEAPRQQQLLGGPRIKHVCRAAAVALGQPRAMVPDDIPRLSALPMHEREGIAPSPTEEAVADVVSDPDSTSDSERPTSSSSSSKKHKQKTMPKRHFGPSGVRSVRCHNCSGCTTIVDCGTCVHCLDKPKFGGPNTKRQCCIHRICSRIALKKPSNWGKGQGTGIRNRKVQVRRGGRSSASRNGSSAEDEAGAEEAAEEEVEGEAEAEASRSAGEARSSRRARHHDLSSPSPSRKQPRRQVTPRSYRDLLRFESDSDEASGAEADGGGGREPAPEPKKTPQSHEAVASSAAAEDISRGSEPITIRPRRLPFGGRPGRRRFDKQDTPPREPPSPAPLPPPSPSSSTSSVPGSPSLKLKLRLQLRLERLPPSVVEAAGGQLTPQKQPQPQLAPPPSHPHPPSPPGPPPTITTTSTTPRLQPQQVDPEGALRMEEEEAASAAGSSSNSSPAAASAPAHTPCLAPPSPQSLVPAAHHAPSTLAALAHRFAPRELPGQRQAALIKHRIRIDFKEDCSVQNVWLMGGLSVLTSVPISPDSVCLLCASKGTHEMVYCLVCCEPFHSFCLREEERPTPDNKENWCCRRCKHCHVCGRKNKHSKPVLQCRRCLYCYHPSCLGPTYPKPLKCNLPWVCMKCIRCKSCGMTPGKSWDMAWNHQRDLCPDCSILHKLGNFCPVCQGCYEENGTKKLMLKCALCSHWVHSKCEEISDEECDRMKKRGAGGFVCTPCGLGSWRLELREELTTGLQTVLAALLDSPLTQDILNCQQCEALDDDALAEHAAECDLIAIGRRLEEGGYTTARDFSEDVATVMRRKLKAENQSPTDELKSFYMQLMKEAFSWLNGGHMKTWEPLAEEFPSGMLPEAVLPPSAEHSYAQWLERDLFGTKGVSGSLSNGQTNGLKDVRFCSLCQQQGDEASNAAGRLLYLGQNEWAHVNCCIWSAEVQEDGGALLHVHAAVTRGRHMRCEHCGLTGATVGCCLTSCQSNYHFMCARTCDCVFQEDRRVYCHKHRDLLSGQEVSGEGFEVLRRIYVNFEGLGLRRKFLTGLEPEVINMMIGSLQIHHLGVLTEVSANSGKLFPVGYKCSRWYWSTVNPHRRCRYTCQVREVHPMHQELGKAGSHGQGSNQTIAHSPAQPHHKAMGTDVGKVLQPMENSTDILSPQAKHNAGSKTPRVSHTRRPVGGLSRPLPSPGNGGSKSHHILTISDLEDGRRPRRLNCPVRGRNASPPQADGSSLLPRSLPFGSPNRQPNSSSSSSLPRSPSTSGLSPPYNVDTVNSHCSPTTDPVSFQRHLSELDEISRDFTALSDTEEAALMPINGLEAGPVADGDNGNDDQAVLLVTDELTADVTAAAEGETVDLVTAQGTVPYGQFDMEDTDEAVASMLSSNFDEALLQENMVLQYRAHTQVDEGTREGAVTEDGQDEDVDVDVLKSAQHKAEPSSVVVDSQCHFATSKEPTSPSGQRPADNDSSDDDMDHYLNFSRTVVIAEAGENSMAVEAAQAGVNGLPVSRTISQLDGADNESESDSGELTGEDDSQELDSEPSSESSGSSVELVSTTAAPEHGHLKASGVASGSKTLAVESQDCLIMDPDTGQFVSGDTAGRSNYEMDDESDGSSEDSLDVDEELLVPPPVPQQVASKALNKPRPFSNPRVRLLDPEPFTTLNASMTTTPLFQQGMVRMGRPRKGDPHDYTTTSPAGRSRTRTTTTPPSGGRSRGPGRSRTVTTSPGVGRSRGRGRARRTTRSPGVGRSRGRGKARMITSPPGVGRSRGRGRARAITTPPFALDGSHSLSITTTPPPTSAHSRARTSPQPCEITSPPGVGRSRGRGRGRAVINPPVTLDGSQSLSIATSPPPSSAPSRARTSPQPCEITTTATPAPLPQPASVDMSKTPAQPRAITITPPPPVPDYSKNSGTPVQPPRTTINVTPQPQPPPAAPSKSASHAALPNSIALPSVSPAPPASVVKSVTPAPPRTAVVSVSAPPPSPSASSPAFRAVPLKDPVTAAPIVINGFGSKAPQNDTPKGKPIVIRLKNPDKLTEQQGAVATSTPPKPPQILLVNRFGQILMKDPQSNTYQSPSTTSPSLNNISQIAKLIHNTQAALPRQVPKVTVTPVSVSAPATVAVAPSNQPRVTAHIISYTRPAPLPVPPANKVLVRRVTLPSGQTKPLLQQQNTAGRQLLPTTTTITAGRQLATTTTITAGRQLAPNTITAGRQLATTITAGRQLPPTTTVVRLDSAPQHASAQSIIDQAMASHWTGQGKLPVPVPIPIAVHRSPKLSPSQFTVHPFLNKLESPQLIGPSPSTLAAMAPVQPTVPVPHRTRPAILRRPTTSQVRVKRVSSVAERLGVKKCRTDFLPQTPSATPASALAMDDPTRSIRVRMKAPSARDILDLDQLTSAGAEQPRPEISRPIVSKQVASKSDLPKPEGTKHETPKSEAFTPEIPKPDVPKSDALKSDAPKPAAPKPAIHRPPITKQGDGKKETTKEGRAASKGGLPTKAHVWVSARDGELSDWGPYSGLSSDEESEPHKRPAVESPRKDKPRLSFLITSDDGFRVEADSIEVAWQAVLDGVQEARIGCGMQQLPASALSGVQLLGVVHSAVLYLLEQLGGAGKCHAHRFRFHHHEKLEEEKELPLNPSGCARAEAYQRKSTFDMFDFLASKHRKLPETTVCDDEDDDLPLKSTRRATNSELPAAMRFRHLKRTSKEAVGVYRSPIHGRGLFGKRNIEAGEMLIEYAGNVIRAVLTDKREKHYDRKGIGCYMFRIDDFDVVDATMHGNAARFINHSCEPNCYSRVINVDGQKHIVIFALRKIYRGEELTYDYKFPKEDANSKLHCNCGARRCRRFLN